MFKFGFGVVQSFFKLLNFKPDVVFIKGGYVGLPVGLATAKFFKNIPIVLHDSDAHPGLTNRLLSRYAIKIGVGMPLKFSEYDKSKTEFVGVPISRCYFEPDQKDDNKLGMPLIFAIGGSQGSRTINEQIAKIAPKFDGKANFLLVAGEENYANALKATEFVNNIKVVSFIPEEEKICEYIKKSKVIITRAGATIMAAISATKAVSIIIPSPYLASDHQTKNAEMFEKSESAYVVYEKNSESDELIEKIDKLLNDKKLCDKFRKNVAKFSKPNAAERMAEIIIGVGNGEETK